MGKCSYIFDVKTNQVIKYKSLLRRSRKHRRLLRRKRREIHTPAQRRGLQVHRQRRNASKASRRSNDRLRRKAYNNGTTKARTYHSLEGKIE